VNAATLPSERGQARDSRGCRLSARPGWIPRSLRRCRRHTVSRRGWRRSSCRHWKQARKINIHGGEIVLDPAGPLGDASWAKQRLGRATQALPNGFCGLPVQKSCPHANACLTCPMFITTAEFLPQHRQQHQQILQIISAADARGQTSVTQMNQQVADNIEKIITALEND
jgi:hypothetical protein